MNINPKLVCLTVVAGLLAFTLTGCDYEEVESETGAGDGTEAAAPAEPETPRPSRSLADSGGSNAPAKAKETAKGTIDEAQRRNRELEKEIDE